MSPEFRFDPIEHCYYLGSVCIPSVTQILDRVGLISDFAKNGTAAERGTVVHLACKLLAENRLDWETIDERITGYVYSYERFLVRLDTAILSLEQPLYDREYLFAGTYDAILAPDLLIDLKTGAPAKWHATQTAAYQRLANINGWAVKRRATIYLQEDGSTAKIIDHTDRTDLAKFLACRAVFDLLEV